MNAVPATDPALADLTARYAAYSRSAGGLSLVIGATLALATFSIALAVELTPGVRFTLAAAPLAWLLAKELLRSAYYQRAGAVRERLSDRQRRNHRWMVGYLVFIALIVVVGVVFQAPAAALQWPTIGYLAIVVALPLAAARWFWSSGDFLVGVLLFCQAAVVIAGGNYSLPWMAFVVLCAGIAAVTGWREHRDYLRLRQQLDLDRSRAT